MDGASAAQKGAPARSGSVRVIEHRYQAALHQFANGVQATTTAQHTLRLDTFEGEEYEGALLYATSSVNNFAFQSIEEIDPVDWWALAGSVGGMWGKKHCDTTAAG